MPERRISFILNGVEKTATVAQDAFLLDILREELNLTGTKRGCGNGECGACTVLVDNQPLASCIYPAVKVDGKSVTTVEGLGSHNNLHPLQTWFLKLGAVQCGFCSPGLLISAKALLERNLNPSVENIHQAISGNLCRCTGYKKVVEAILAAAAELRGEHPQSRKDVEGDGAIGRSLARVDGIPKLMGIAQYAEDLKRPGMLYGAMLVSPHPHARILSIDTDRALSMDGVVAVLTSKDVPGPERFGIITKDQPFLAVDKVRYAGEPVAVVIGHNEDVARWATKEIQVNYQILPPVFDPQEAMQPDAVKIHKAGNILIHRKLRKGNIEEGFKRADIVVQRQCTTPTVEHAYIEPEAALSYWEGETLTIQTPTQAPHHKRFEIARMLNLPVSRVRVIQVTTGGGFGGKIELALVHLAALGTYVTGRPVKMVWTREESFITSTKRHAFFMDLQMGATKNGRLTAAKVRIIGNTGAYASLGPAVITRSITLAIGPYECPNVHIDSYGVYTNTQIQGAMRGFGTPQLATCHEPVLDEIARKCELSPLEIRRLNMLRPGSVTLTQQVLEAGVGALETLEKVATEFKPVRKKKDSLKKRGLGIASIWYGIGSTGMPNPSSAQLELLEDGSCIVQCGAADLGQGSDTTLIQIAAETLGLSPERVRIKSADTLVTPEAGKTTASRQTYVSGNAVRLAAEEVRSFLLDSAADEMEANREDLIIRNDSIFVRGSPEIHLEVGQLCRKLRSQGILTMGSGTFNPQTPQQLDPETGAGIPYGAYAYGTQLVEVEVDLETGQFEILRVVAAHDVGRAINPMNVEGQIEGGVLMGLGYATMEEMVWNDGGQLLTTNFKNYLLPTSLDMPPIKSIIVEEPDPSGPFGAKGLGEPPVCPTAAAVINAIYDAIGVDITSLPITAEKVYNGIQKLKKAPRYLS